MNRRGFFKTLLAGTVCLFATTLPSPAEPEQTISFDRADGGDTTGITLLDNRDGRIIRCWRFEDRHTEEALNALLKVHIEEHRKWLRVNNKYF